MRIKSTNGMTGGLGAALCGVAASLLVACGGGGGSSSSASPSSTGGATVVAEDRVGVFLDAPVQGLTVRRADGRTQLTGEQGQFAYADGETLSFYLGPLKLGDVTGQAVLNPVDVTGASGLSDVRAINLLRLLQGLDADDDLGNGIALSASVLSSAADALRQLDLSLATDAFGASAALQTLLAARGAQARLPAADAAVAHFEAQRQALGDRGVYDGVWHRDGLSDGTTSGTGTDVATSGVSSAQYLYAGIYTTANGGRYSIHLGYPVDGLADLQVASVVNTAFGSGSASNVPKLLSDRGTVTLSGQTLQFTGVNGHGLTLQRRAVPRLSSAGRLYVGTAAGQATWCASGALVLTVPDGYGLTAGDHIGLVHAGADGLRFTVSALWSYGSARLWSGDVTLTSDSVTFVLPTQRLTLPLSGNVASTDVCAGT